MLKGWEKTVFSTDAVDGKPLEHDVYTKGDGAVVLLIQELPGIGPETFKLADLLVERGFRVVMPHLFGPLGKVAIGTNIVRLFCMRREFSLFAKNKTSPIVSWLRALCVDLRETYKVKGVGVIGMCLTGNFAISLMADDAVLAGVALQPSMPIFAKNDLHMSAQDIGDVRNALEQKGAMLAMRFAGDKICTPEKFEALDKAFNDDKTRINLRTLPGKGHSTLTLDFMDEDGSPTVEALNEVSGYLKDMLNGAGA